MEKHQPSPPRLAKWLLKISVPNYLKDEISGDLEEEYNQFITIEKGESMANRWFWHQSIATALRYLFTKQRLLSALLILIALCILTLLYIAITSLSYANGEYFKDDFWYNGNIHLLFFESKFWTFASDEAFNHLFLMHLIDLNSALFSAIALFVVLKLNKKFELKAFTFGVLSLCLMLTPYLYGFTLFKIATLTNQEVGPLIAFMWLPIMYMILPMTYLTVKKIHTYTTENLVTSNK